MTINAIERALLILKEMAVAPDGVSVRELARQMAISPAVIQKSLQALVHQGFAEQDATTQHYHLGPVAVQVGLAGLAKLEIREIARPYLRALADETQETALLAILQSDHAVYVEKALSPLEIRLDVPIGSRRPLNCTGIGKILLAHLPNEHIEKLAKKGAFVAPTSASIVDLDSLQAEIAAIRANGIAFDREEYAPGTMCVAAPVFSHEGHVVAAATISGPTQRVAGREQEIGAKVREAAEQISAALGYRRELSRAATL